MEEEQQDVNATEDNIPALPTHGQGQGVAAAEHGPMLQAAAATDRALQHQQHTGQLSQEQHTGQTQQQQQVLQYLPQLGQAVGSFSPQQLQQQQQPSWAGIWHDSSSGSGSSLGLLLGQTSAGLPAAEASGELLPTETAAAGTWHAERRSSGSRGGSPLDLLGRLGHPALPQQLSRHLSVPTSGVLAAGGMQYSTLSLPASPTMLQHQYPQLQQVRGQYSISSGSGAWPDVEMEPPPPAAAAAAGAGDNNDNGESLLLPGGGLLPPSSSPHLLQQPGVPLGLRLRTSAASQQQRRQPPQTFEGAAAAPQQYGQPVQQSAAGGFAAAAGLQHYGSFWSGGRATPEQLLQDQQLMPPPLPPQSSGAPAAPGRPGPRPPPLIIPSTQPQQPTQQQQQLLAPTPSPAPPQSGTSVTPAMLTMALADTPGGVPVSTAAFTGVQADIDSSGGGGRARRPRRRTSVPSSPAVPGTTPAAAAAAAAAAPAGAAALVDAGRRYLQVVCGNLTGWLDITDMMIQVQGEEQEENPRVTPAAFEALAGKASTRKWRQSLSVMPLGPDDQIVPESIALGDFMKQYQLDRPTTVAGQLGRASSSSIGAWEEGLVSPGRHPALVFPGVRRRRQSQPSSQESLDQAAAETSAEDQPPTHVKRSRGAARSAQPQQQLLPPEQQWQQPAAIGSGTMLGEAGSGLLDPQLMQQHRQQGEEKPYLQQVGAWPAAAAAAAVGLRQQQQQEHQLQRSYSAEQPHAAVMEGGLQLSQPQQQTAQAQLQQQPYPRPQHWRPYSPQPLAYSASSPAAGLEYEQPVVLPPDPVALGQRQQQRRRRQQLSGPSDQAELAAASQLLQQQVPAADVPTRTAAAAGQLLSPSGRPLRQPASSRRAAAASTTAAGRYERGSQPAAFKGGIRHLQVWCDQLPGMLDLFKMQVVPQEGQCEGQPMSLSAFEQLGGRGTARKWRRSLTTMDGDELISLGEWLERHQIFPGTEKYVSPKVSPKPRGSTPPAAAAAGPGRPPTQGVSWLTRDQQAAKLMQQRQQYAPVHPGAISVPAAAAAAVAAAQGGGQEVPVVSLQQEADYYSQAAGDAWLAMFPSLPTSISGPAVATEHEGFGGFDVRRLSRDTGSLQPHTQQPASAAAAVAEPINPELLLMLTEYASEFNHPELGLHPEQVEQDLADITALSAGGAGLLSPRLGDWQQQQQFHHQEQHRQGFDPGVRPQSHLQRTASAGAEPGVLARQQQATSPAAVAAVPGEVVPATWQQQAAAGMLQLPQYVAEPAELASGAADVGGAGGEGGQPAEYSTEQVQRGPQHGAEDPIEGQP